MKRSEFLQHASGMMSRRSFLRLSGILGIGFVSATAIPTGAEAVKFNRRLYKISKTRLAMGTFVSMTLIHGSKDQAQEAMGEAFLEMDRLARMISRFDETTAVAQLNREGYLKDIPPEVAAVVARSLAYYRISNGAFDISVKPVVDLFKETFSNGQKMPPNGRELQEALRLVNASNIEFGKGVVRFRRPGMGITLDGIAKGYIVDRASEVLARHRITNHLINAGGDIRTMGHRRDKKPWTIAVQDPQKQKHYPDIIHLTDGAVATSGNYEIYFDREKMFHHIVNPHTGLSPEESTSVSVLADTAMAADALSTSVFVMTPEHGTRFINALSGCESLVVAKGNKKIRSAGWKSAVS
ncbi:MAG: FAD:protein FMN transferase [Deltaproteobacteria bacterium]|nr:FAD:protein FMN transferase [Deltaproteobacteria bacterium]